ncbi:hypothetical protein IEQ34_014621 [Dendrobium chrysotoxum]|uniref:Uncharacterized protein n=1 Tax=Dendrobium chrysotoxum TaxID=161865 RepID=A0AAV7GLZ6_DENCH|nr:hypothetical protein IEQ34_014621 [Dendrobium chrysotoxum]
MGFLEPLANREATGWAPGLEACECCSLREGGLLPTGRRRSGGHFVNWEEAEWGGHLELCQSERETRQGVRANQAREGAVREWRAIMGGETAITLGLKAILLLVGNFVARCSFLHLDMVGVLITCPGRDLGFLGAVNAVRCRKLPGNEEDIFMGEGEQMEAEEDAERLLRRTEKRAFAAFKISSLADSTPPSLPLPLRVEPKTKSGIRQQDLLKKIVEVKPKKPRVSTLSEQTKVSLSTPVLPQPLLATPAEHCTGELPSTSNATGGLPKYLQTSSLTEKRTMNDSLVTRPIAEVIDSNLENPVKSLLGITYDSSDED